MELVDVVCQQNRAHASTCCCLWKQLPTRDYQISNLSPASWCSVLQVQAFGFGHDNGSGFGGTSTKTWPFRWYTPEYSGRLRMAYAAAQPSNITIRSLSHV